MTPRMRMCIPSPAHSVKALAMIDIELLQLYFITALLH